MVGNLTNIRANDIVDVFEVSVDWILYVDEEKIQSIKKWLTGYKITQNIEKKFGIEFIMNLKIELYERNAKLCIKTYIYRKSKKIKYGIKLIYFYSFSCFLRI